MGRRLSTNKPEIIILRGLPGAGKTRWALRYVQEDPLNRVRVNKDALRAMMGITEYSKETEENVVVARDALVKGLLVRGLSVVVDDTNLRLRHVKQLARMAILGQWRWEVRDFNTDLAECIRRDANRMGMSYVGKTEITAMHDKYLRNGWPQVPTVEEIVQDPTAADTELYFPDTTKSKAVIIDVDGTVALRGTRDPFDESRVHEDMPNERIINIIKADLMTSGADPIFVTGRTQACYAATRHWLEDHMIPSGTFSLIMRPVGDGRPDFELKLEMFNRFIRHEFNVLGAYDDRDQVVAMWRSIGLPCLQVADGAF